MFQNTSLLTCKALPLARRRSAYSRVGYADASRRRQRRCDSRSRAFSLVEIMVAVSILALLLIVTFTIVNQTGRVWRSTTAMTGAFRESRAAFESITRRLSQATLNPYFDYVNSNGQTRPEVGASFVPARYERQSELHFVTGAATKLLGASPSGISYHGHGMFFQAPLGFSDKPSTGDAQLVNLLNATGFFVQRSDDSNWRPKFLDSASIPSRTRYRLMQFVQSTEQLSIYANPSITSINQYNWFRNALNTVPAPARPIAENVLLLVFTPLEPGGAEDTLTSDYEYNSKSYLFNPSGAKEKLMRNQLPPAVRVTMVALDETSASRMEDKYPGAPPAYLSKPTLFSNTATFQADLDSVVAGLVDDKLTHRVFSTAVVIRQSKFSKS